MGYKRAMYLLSLIYPNADKNREKVAKLFKEAIMKTEEYQSLSTLLQISTFFGTDGSSMYAESKKTIETALFDIQNAQMHIRTMNLLVQQINQELNKMNELLIAPTFFESDIVVVKNDAVDQYNRFFKSLANAICYYLLNQYGVKGIRDLRYNFQDTFKDLVRLMNQTYANVLNNTWSTDKPRAWMISYQEYHGDNLNKYIGYKIEYTDVLLSRMLISEEQGEYKRVAPFLFVATSPKRKYMYMGFGNIVSVNFNEAISLLDTNLITSLRVDAFDKGEIKREDPIGEISRALNSDAFCISPEDFVCALNRWSLNQTIIYRQKNRLCIFCGKGIAENRVACASHFSFNI